MSGPTESTVADQLATARKDVESMRLAWDERGREIDRLNAEVSRMTRERDDLGNAYRVVRESCQQERNEGNGGCGCCTLCNKESRDRVLAAEAVVARLTRERDGWQEEARVYCQNATHQREQREAAESALSEAREVVRNCVTQMTRATVFVQSREKMHVAGLALFLSASESARSWLARLDAQTNKEDHHG